MAEIDIPHAINTFIQHDSPREILHVVTALAEMHGEPSFDAGAKHDMMVAIAKAVAANRLDSYVVHWSAKALAAKPKHRPADVIGNAVHVMRVLTGEADDNQTDDGKDPAARAMGAKGGAARAANMTAERRAEIARNAAKLRWAARSK